LKVFPLKERFWDDESSSSLVSESESERVVPYYVCLLHTLLFYATIIYDHIRQNPKIEQQPTEMLEVSTIGSLACASFSFFESSITGWKWIWLVLRS